MALVGRVHSARRRTPGIIELSLPFDPSTALLIPHQLTSAEAAMRQRDSRHRDTIETASRLPTETPTPSTPAAPPTTTTTGPVDTVTPEERAGWEQVAMCEEGGDWQYDGATYSGGLGISRTNWDAYGGLEFAPEGAEATEDQQIMVAERIQFTPPDEDGCTGW